MTRGTNDHLHKIFDATRFEAWHILNSADRINDGRALVLNLTRTVCDPAGRLLNFRNCSLNLARTT